MGEAMKSEVFVVLAVYIKNLLLFYIVYFIDVTLVYWVPYRSILSLSSGFKSKHSATKIHFQPRFKGRLRSIQML